MRQSPRPALAGLALAIAAVICPLTAKAQKTPYLVRDINTATRDSSPGPLWW